MDNEFLEKGIFSIEEIKECFPNERSMRHKLKRLLEEGRIAKIKSGLYATVNPLDGEIFAGRYEIGSHLFPDSYIGYHSALEFHGFANQTYSEVQVFSKNRNLPFLYKGLEYRFYLSPMEEGILDFEGNISGSVTDIERTLIDCVDRIDLAGGIEELILAILDFPYLNEKRLLAYLKGYKKKCLYQKIGLLLSKLKGDAFSKAFYEECRSLSSERVTDIRENKMLPHSYSKYWGVIYSSSLDEGGSK